MLQGYFDEFSAENMLEFIIKYAYITKIVGESNFGLYIILSAQRYKRTIV